MFFVLGRRVANIVPTLAAVIAVVFLLFSVLPGSFISAMNEDGRTTIDPAVMERMRKEMGLDDPLHERFLKYIGKVVTGDLGTSFRTREPVTKLISARTLAMLLQHAARCEPMGPDPYDKHREALQRYEEQLRNWAATCASVRRPPRLRSVKSSKPAASASPPLRSRAISMRRRSGPIPSSWNGRREAAAGSRFRKSIARPGSRSPTRRQRSCRRSAICSRACQR